MRINKDQTWKWVLQVPVGNDITWSLKKTSKSSCYLAFLLHVATPSLKSSTLHPTYLSRPNGETARGSSAFVDSDAPRHVCHFSAENEVHHLQT